MGPITLTIPGTHNVVNSLAAVAVGSDLGLTFDAIRQGLQSFTGVDRRFQLRGEAGGVTVIDDYGHHPTEVKVTLETLKALAAGRRTVVLFQPHRYTRTEALWDDFCRAFHLADVVLVTDIYAASEEPIPGVTAETLAQAIAERGHRHAVYAGDLKRATEALAAEARAGDDELIVNTEEMRRVEIRESGEVTAEGGANLIRTVVRCCREGWRGMESAVGIPGSIGGAAVMNAGAYGFSISDALREIVVYAADGERAEPPEGWGFHYRGSSIPQGSPVASLTLRLHPEDPARLETETRELAQQRVKSQPAGRNAGCVFKNPEGGHAGRMIDGLGLKGTRIGGAVVSPRHANFLVNEGAATAGDVLALLDLVRERVHRETGVDLELEVKVLWTRER